MLCSVLIPSRKRHLQLKRCVDSIRASASGSDFEILCRWDSDDALTGLWASRLGIVSMSGPRLGYARIGDYMQELCDASTGRWVWTANDDMEVFGEGWDAKLAAIPTKGFIVQPEISKLGESTYGHAQSQAFPMFPRNCWKLVGYPVIPNASDVVLDEKLRNQLGWKTAFLEGITMHHHRPTDAELRAHRL